MKVDDVLMEAVRVGAVRVPPYPSTAMTLQKVLSNPGYTTAQLVDAMRTDAVFAGNILRLANSPFYRRGDAVTSLSTAVARIGAKELTRLAMASTVSSAATHPGLLSAHRRRTWRGALTCAMVCEALAKTEGADPDEAFVAGLLHDCGALLIIGCLEEALARTKEAPPDDQVISTAISEHHLGFGALLATRWQLPPALADAITAHHDSKAAAALTRRVQQADRIAAALEDRASLDELALAEVTGQSALACRSLVELIPMIPTAIAAFDAGSPVSRSELRRDGPVEASRPSVFAVTVKGTDHSTVLDVHQATTTGFIAITDRAFPVNRLIEVEVVGAGTSVWAVVQKVTPIGASFELTCSLFALAPEVARAWAQLIEVRGARAA
jgi:HD-like signal output (HDOD) protein